jgi:hypothetical protein
MSSVRFVFPKLKLEQLLRTPGGLPVAEALAQAKTNLETLRPTCLAELLELLVQAEASFVRLGPDADPAVLAELYAIAVRGIGAGAVCGAPAVDDALGSLCELLDRALTGGGGHRDAIGVHVRSWRLLMDPDLPKPGAAAILAGLQKISTRIAASAS